MLSSRLRLLPLLVLALFAPALGAQNCLGGDDGLFTNGCCNLVSPQLPSFPQWSSRAQWITIRNCTPEIRGRSEFKISRPQFIDCDRVEYEARFSVDFGTGTVYQWEGKLFGKYARTFGYVTRTNRVAQVWRFMLNGDFRLVNSTPFVNPAEVPPSLPVFNAVHFVGHIDYCCDGQGGYDIAASLQHFPGCIAHGVVSNRPLTGPASHPDRSYYLIAPENFNVATMQGTEPQGIQRGEDLRVNSTPFARCFSESPLRQASVDTLVRACPCIGPVGSMPWVVQETVFAPFCPSPFQITVWQPQQLGPVGPAGLNAQVVGNWTVPAGTFPEGLTLIHYQVFVATDDPILCNPDLGERQFLHGVGTKGNKHLSLHPSVSAFGSFDNAVDLVNCVNPQNQAFQWGEQATASMHIGLFIN